MDYKDRKEQDRIKLLELKNQLSMIERQEQQLDAQRQEILAEMQRLSGESRILDEIIKEEAKNGNDSLPVSG